MPLIGIGAGSALSILRAGSGAKGLSLAVQPVAETSTLALDPLAAAYKSWTNEPPGADRLGRTRYGSMVSRLSPALWADVFDFTRASSAADLDRTGALQTLGTDLLRAGFDADGNPAGWLVETAVTNALRSNDGTGAVAFTGTPARLSATTDGNAITGVTVLDGGSGYSIAPTVAFGGGGGSGATATATISGGAVTGVTVNNGGTGYAVAPAVFARSGTPPTGMSTGGAWSLVGVGTEDGIPYVDLRLRTPGGGAPNIYTDVTLDNSAALNMTPPATWTLSAYCRLVGGSWANVGTSSLLMYGAPGFNDNTSASLLGVTGAPLRKQRFSTTKTFTTAGNTAMSPRITAHVSGEVDLTLRVGLAQAEVNHYASTPIRTSGATVTRAGDDLRMEGNAFQQVFGAGASQGAVWLDAIMGQQAGAVAQYFLQVDDGGLNNRYMIYNAAGTAAQQVQVVVGGVATAGLSPAAALPIGAPFRLGIRWGFGVFSVCHAGIISNTSPMTLPSGLAALRVAGSLGATRPMNGRVRGLYCAPRAPSDAKFLAASVLGADIDAILSAP